MPTATTTICLSMALANRCGIALQALECGTPVVNDSVGVPVGALPPDEALRHQQALPFLESWAKADNAAAWLHGELVQGGAATHTPLTAARQAANFLDCQDFLVQTARLSLLFLRQVKRPGFEALSRGEWPRFKTQFGRQVLAEMQALDLSCEQLSVDHMSLDDRHVSPDLFDDTVEGLDRDGTLFLNPLAIRATITWLGFKPTVYEYSFEERRVLEADDPYVTVSLPLTLLQRFRVTSVCVTAKAHDQGWSSFRSDYGTTNNCWSFADLAIFSSQPYRVAELVHRHERVYTNLHAVEDWQEHWVRLGPDTQLVQSINSWADAQPRPAQQQEQARQQQLEQEEEDGEAEGEGVLQRAAGQLVQQHQQHQTQRVAAVQQVAQQGYQAVANVFGHIAKMVGISNSTAGQQAGRAGVGAGGQAAAGAGEGPGLLVQLRLRAMYPAWMHYVQRGAVLVDLEARPEVV